MNDAWSSRFPASLVPRYRADGERITMRAGRRWDVPEDFWILWWRSRELHRLVLQAELEPAGKGRAGTRSAPEFQRQIMDQMEAYGRYPMTGLVALDLHFHATKRNPPSIHRAAKYTLDVLGAAVPGTERARRRAVLYHDDRQVKFLYVDMDQGWSRPTRFADRPGSVFIVARRASDVIADLCMADRLSRSSYDREDDSPFSSPDPDVDPEPAWLLESGSTRSPLEQYVSDWLRFRDVTREQKEILASTDAGLIGALAMYLEGNPRSDGIGPLAAIFEGSQAASRNLLLSSPLTLPLPGLPRSEGQFEDFAGAIRRQLEEFRAQRPLFQSLVVPVTLTFLVVPPEQGKDLDNIALTALPIAHEVLRPHIEPHLLAPTLPEDPEPWREEALARLKSLNAQSVSAYQVIELPRSAEDAPEGTLRLALGRHTHHSWWDQATRYLGAAIERAHKRGGLTDSTWERVFSTW